MEAHSGTWLSNMDNDHQVNWGTLRGNLEFMEMQMSMQGNFMEHTIPTWRCWPCPFPHCQVLEEKEDTPELQVQTGFKYSLDIKIQGDMDQWAVGQMVHAAVENLEFKKHYGQNTCLIPRSRRSNGHQGRLDAIEAPSKWSNTLDRHTHTLYNLEHALVSNHP